MIAYVAGHTHENKVAPVPATGRRRHWWEIDTSAIADWPQQSRLIEVMDNQRRHAVDLRHAVDTAAPLGRARPPARPRAFGVDQLASISRTFAYNDPQRGGGTGEGAAAGPERRAARARPADQ